VFHIQLQLVRAVLLQPILVAATQGATQLVQQLHRWVVALVVVIILALNKMVSVAVQAAVVLLMEELVELELQIKVIEAVMRQLVLVELVAQVAVEQGRLEMRQLL
jgi:hypothetical protein